MNAKNTAQMKQESGSAWRAVRLSWKLLSDTGKRRAILIAFGNILVSLIDTASLVGVMPLVSLIVEPEVVNSNNIIRTINEFLGNPEIDGLIRTVAFASFALLTLSVVANYAMMIANKRFRIACQNRLAKQVMSSCLHAPYEWNLRQNSNALAHNVFYDILAWSSGGIHGTIAIVGHSSLLVLVAIVVFSAAAFQGIIGMAIIGTLAMVVILALRVRIRVLSELRRTTAANAFAFAREILGGIKDLKLSGREGVFIDVYQNAFNTYGQTMGDLKILQAVPPLLMIFLGQAGIVIIAILLWHLGLSSGEIATEMALVLLVTARAIPATTRLVGEIGTLWSSLPNIEGISQLVAQLSPEVIERDADTKMSSESAFENWNRIEFRKLNYRYSSDRGGAIINASGEITKGGSYGIVGPTGAGKTTLVDLILGLLYPPDGGLLVDGVRLDASNTRAWRRKIGYVPQSPLIVDDTLAANVAFGVPADAVDEAQVKRCLEKANLSSVFHSIGLSGRVGESGNKLSGGQRQRVAIARALYDEPNLLVLDEATSALDTLSEREIQIALNNLHGDITTIVIAHRLSTIENCDEIFVLDRGSIVARGDYGSLLVDSQLFKKMVVSGKDDASDDVGAAK